MKKAAQSTTTNTKQNACSSSSKNKDDNNPVIRIKQQNNGCGSAPNISLDHMTLDDLLYPLSKQEFLSNYFLTKAVHISSCDHGENTSSSSSKEQSRITTSNERTSNKRRRTTKISSSSEDKNGDARMKTKTSATKTNGDDDDNNHRQKKDAQNTSSRLEDITHGLYDLNVKEIMIHTSSDNIFIWIGSDKKIQSIEMDDKDSAYLLYEKGHHAAYCRAPPHVEQPLVANLLKETGLGCGQYDPSGTKSNVLARGEVECFFGIRGHFTNWHTDFQENFTIQLTGRKKWKLQSGTVKHPIRGCTPHYQCTPDIIENQLKASRLSNQKFSFPQKQQPNATNSFGLIDEVIMNPGDILYFPAGMWHCVETLEDGLSINVSLMTTNYAQLVCQSLQHYLLSTSQNWNQPILNNSVTNVKTTLQGLLTDLPNILQQFVGNSSSSQHAHAAVDCIVPPILRHAPTFTTKADDDSDNENENETNGGDDDKNDDNDEQEYNNKDDIHPSEHDDEEEAVLSIMEQEDDKDDDDDETLMINLNTFEPPDEWIQNEWEPQIFLVKQNPQDWIIIRNPLALLLSETEVSQQPSEEQTSSHYILNVNYAGNEALESMIRLKLCYDSNDDHDDDDEQEKDTNDKYDNNILDLLINAQKNHLESQTLLQTTYVPPILIMHVSDNHRHKKNEVNGGGKTTQQPKELKLNLPPPCLFYFGYLVWKKKQKCC